MNDPEVLVLDFTRAEAVVLIALLERIENDDRLAAMLVDQAEQRVLWDLQCQLERGLGDFGVEELKSAREALRDRTENDALPKGE